MITRTYALVASPEQYEEVKGAPYDPARESESEVTVWRWRDEVADLTHPHLLEAMVAEADAEGYEPSDPNWAGLPNIYLRAEYGQYSDGIERWHRDGFAMRVRAKSESANG